MDEAVLLVDVDLSPMTLRTTIVRGGETAGILRP
jgi:hypothetical protein